MCWKIPEYSIIYTTPFLGPNGRGFKTSLDDLIDFFYLTAGRRRRELSSFYRYNIIDW